MLKDRVECFDCGCMAMVRGKLLLTAVNTLFWKISIASFFFVPHENEEEEEDRGDR